MNIRFVLANYFMISQSSIPPSIVSNKGCGFRIALS